MKTLAVLSIVVSVVFIVVVVVVAYASEPVVSVLVVGDNHLAATLESGQSWEWQAPEPGTLHLNGGFVAGTDISSPPVWLVDGEPWTEIAWACEGLADGSKICRFREEFIYEARVQSLLELQIPGDGQHYGEFVAVFELPPELSFKTYLPIVFGVSRLADVVLSDTTDEQYATATNLTKGFVTIAVPQGFRTLELNGGYLVNPRYDKSYRLTVDGQPWDAPQFVVGSDPNVLDLGQQYFYKTAVGTDGSILRIDSRWMTEVKLLVRLVR